MKPWSNQSIAGKLTRMNLTVCGIALLLAYVSFVLYDLYSLRQALRSDLDTEAQIIGSNCVAPLLFDDPQAAQTTLAALRGSPHVLAAVVYTNDGQTFASFARKTTGGAKISARLAPNERSGNWSYGDQQILVGRRIDSQGTDIGSVYILAETTDVAYRARQFGLLSAGILIICFIVALVATSTIRTLVSSPLTALAQTAVVVTRERNYAVRAESPGGSDEISLLITSFNEMLEQIQQRDLALEESRRGLEQKVQERTAELQAANQELEAFSYSVAHDLRGPLQQITNLGFLLQNSAEIPREGDSAKLASKVMESARRMSTLIDDLLNLSRAASSPLHYRPIDMTRLVHSILESLIAEKGDRDVQVVVSPGAHAIADEGLISLVLENLLRNAWKYSSKRNPAKIEFGYREAENEIVFFVKDNGVGFNPNYADRLFRPFQRLHSHVDFPGTGVGLATVQRIIARHGGRVWAEGSVDQGAKFSFSLPYKPPEAGEDGPHGQPRTR
ncbi:MAG TPA: ATP-binding protein [Terracidiphilus sp.]|nr:ATP-binding protein [Terracidiphilus sp.]